MAPLRWTSRLSGVIRGLPPMTGRSLLPAAGAATARRRAQGRGAKAAAAAAAKTTSCRRGAPSVRVETLRDAPFVDARVVWGPLGPSRPRRQRRGTGSAGKPPDLGQGSRWSVPARQGPLSREIGTGAPSGLDPRGRRRRPGCGRPPRGRAGRPRARPRARRPARRARRPSDAAAARSSSRTNAQVKSSCCSARLPARPSSARWSRWASTFSHRSSTQCAAPDPAARPSARQVVLRLLGEDNPPVGVLAEGARRATRAGVRTAAEQADSPSLAATGRSGPKPSGGRRPRSSAWWRSSWRCTCWLDPTAGRRSSPPRSASRTVRTRRRRPGGPRHRRRR